MSSSAAGLRDYDDASEGVAGQQGEQQAAAILMLAEEVGASRVGQHHCRAPSTRSSPGRWPRAGRRHERRSERRGVAWPGHGRRRPCTA
jgi:hypothetical protein